jgi:hypothetical protein
MAYYYVKNGGTATGDGGRFGSQQSGSFATLGASSYYNDIQDAIDNSTTSPIAGDFINPSDLHVFTTTNIITYQSTVPTPFFIVSVDDANIDAARTSGNRGTETCTSETNDIVIDSAFISGVKLESSDNIIFRDSNTIQDSVLRVSNSGDVAASLTGDHNSVCIINCEIAIDHAQASGSIVTGGSVFDMRGGIVTTTSLGINNFFNVSGDNGGCGINIKGVDLTAITGNIFGNSGSNLAQDDTLEINLDMCKIASGVVFANEVFKMQFMRLIATRCSFTSDDAEYRYHAHIFGGNVNDDDTIFRNEDEPFTESNQKISYEIVTNADVSLGSPLWFDFPILRYSKLSDTAEDTLRFYITSATALTDKDIYVDISYPDGTNKQTPIFLTSAPATVGGTLDLMATGTTLTTDGTSTWTGGLANKYQMDVDTSSDVGSDCQPVVKIYVTIPSVTIHIASEYGLS